MTTLQVINAIAKNPEYKNIVIKDEGDRMPMQAIERLSENYEDERNINWMVNGTLEKNTLLVYTT